MNSRRKPLDTALFRSKDNIEQQTHPTNGDMSPEVRLKRVSFDIRQEQYDAITRIQARQLESGGRKSKVAELAQEAFDLLMEKYGVL